MSRPRSAATEPAAFTSLTGLTRWPRLGDDARGRLASVTDVAEAWRVLWSARLKIDAIWALAATLPIRRAVWWATLAAWHCAGDGVNRAADQAFAALMDWLRHPDAERMAEAGLRAQAVGLDQPVGYAARAASLADLLEAAEAVATAVCLAQERAGASYDVFLALGRSVADGALDLP